MKNFLTQLAVLSAFATTVACVADAPKRQGPTRPGVDTAPSQGVNDNRGNNDDLFRNEKTCEDRGLVTSPNGGCESPSKSCESQGKVTGSDGECVEKPANPAGDTPANPATVGDTPAAPAGDTPAAPAGDTPAAPSTAGKSDGKSITIKALQNTFLISLDTAKPNCFVAQGATITVDTTAAKEFAANPAQVSAKVLESSTNCPAGAWNHFKSHFK